MQLSQVSRWFRNVALGTRALWATLSSTSPLRLTEMLITRAGPNESFYATIHLNSLTKISPFLDCCRSTISQWKTLTLKYYVWNVALGPWMDKILEESRSSVAANGLPSFALEELVVDGGNRDPQSDWIFPNAAGHQPWSGLHTLRFSYFLPSPSSPLSTISTLVIVHKFDSFINPSPMRALLKLLLKTSLGAEISDGIMYVFFSSRAEHCMCMY